MFVPETHISMKTLEKGVFVPVSWIITVFSKPPSSDGVFKSLIQIVIFMN